MTAPFLQNRREFLSIWEIAHAWEGHEPANADSANAPEDIRHWTNKIILDYFRKELTLRKQNGYRVLPEDVFLLVFNLNRYRKRLGVLSITVRTGYLNVSDRLIAVLRGYI